ncbi:MAG TPA: 3-hydroxyacyl-ACP dehydratase FabZ [Clostridiaceae bacterium]|jgi:3-hydroxyacyl-[acyl-carrier-protein] dehydratase|nr:3-hydroxyacyl-ACP dehydratase FabZ [Clostridiaceae bacterium]
MLNVVDIQKIIPHRYPFLLIDKILEVEPGKKAVGLKNVTINEPFFQGHFPGNPIMPGVLVIEALAQTACVAGLLMEENKGKLGVFTGFENIKFRKPVLPGDTLRLEAEFLAFKMGMGKAKVCATVDGKVAVEGEIKFALIDPDKVK